MGSGKVRVKYKRILLKLSGEALIGSQKYGIDFKIMNKIAKQIKDIHNLNVQIAIVIGGGNIFRGATVKEMDRVAADYMGMLATVINSLALQDVLEKHQVETRVLTAIEMEKLAEPYIRRKALRHLEKRRVVIFAAGTGNPYFSTDTAAALRAIEISADVLLKATKVDGVYDCDPMKNPKAKKFSKLTYLEALNRELKAMDSTAVSLCMDNKFPIIVFNLGSTENIKKIVLGENIGTMIS